MSCGTVDPDALVTSLLVTSDCTARALGGDGWHALATSGLFAALLAALLTVAVAWQGYRLLGGSFAPRDGVALVLRLGIVIALATSWQAYDRLIYRVATDGPAELGRLVFPAAGIETATLDRRLQNAYDAIRVNPDPVDDSSRSGAQPTSERAQTPPPSEGLPGSGRAAAAQILVITAAGSWIATRLVLGLLLALGPIAILAALFDVSIGLCAGWLRALTGAALASLAIPLVVSFELQLLDGPVRAAREAGSADVPGLAIIVWSFALVIAGTLIATQRMAGGLGLGWLRRIGEPRDATRDHHAAPAATPMVTRDTHRIVTAPAPFAPSRAHVIARASERRVGSAGRTLSVSDPRAAIALPAPASAVSRRGMDLVDQSRRASAGRRSVSGKRLELSS